MPGGGVGEYERRAQIMCGDVWRLCAEIMCGDYVRRLCAEICGDYVQRWAGILVRKEGGEAYGA